jgi:S-adenosylmethionine decarboxylase
MRQPATTAAATTIEKRHAMFGSQVVLDLYDCETTHLDDLEWVKATLVNAALAAGATIVDTVFHKFAPWGISGVVVIAESHLAIHIWPENRYAAVDVFTCG